MTTMFYGGAATFLLVDGLMMRGVQHRLITSVVLLVAGMAYLGLLHFVLCLPVFHLTGKLAN